jgi:hypothetical protein
VRKQSVAESIVRALGERQLTFTISAATPDRERDTLSVEG